MKHPLKLKKQGKTVISILIILLLALVIPVLFSSCTAYKTVARVENDKTLHHNGLVYYPILPEDEQIIFFAVGEILGKTQNGHKLHSIKHDSSGEYLCLISKDEKTLYSKQAQLKLSKEKISSLYLEYMGGYTRRHNEEKALADLLFLEKLSGKELKFSYNEALVDIALLYACYDDSPIAREWIGELGRVDEHFVFVPRGNRSLNMAGDFKSDAVQTAIIIEDETLLERIAFLTGIE